MADSNANLSKCNNKQKLMLTYSIFQIGSRVVSAAALTIIAFGLGSVVKESKMFNRCVNEITNQSGSISYGVRYCNGGSF